MLTLTAFIWGTAFVAQRFGMDHVGPITFIAVRFIIGTFSLLPVILVNSFAAGKKAEGLQKTTVATPLLKAGIYCGIVVFVCGLFQQAGLLYTTVGKSGFITTLYIVIVPILGLFFGRRVGWRTWCCVAAACAGMYMLCVNESFTLNRGDVYTLFSAVLYAVHILLVDKYSPLVDGVKLSCLQFFVCAVFASAGAFIFEKPQIGPITAAILPLLYTGVLSSGVAFTLQIIGQRYVSPVVASLVMSLESVFAALTGWIIFSETMTSKEMTGCVLIFAANITVQVMALKNKE